MNKLDKFLSKLDKKLREIIKQIIILIISSDLSGLDVKKLKGPSSVYRVRVGRIRIIFEQTNSGNKILEISFRSDNIY